MEILEKVAIEGLIQKNKAELGIYNRYRNDFIENCNPLY